MVRSPEIRTRLVNYLRQYAFSAFFTAVPACPVSKNGQRLIEERRERERERERELTVEPHVEKK
jgi:hypothetical protein